MSARVDEISRRRPRTTLHSQFQGLIESFPECWTDRIKGNLAWGFVCWLYCSSRYQV